MTGRRSGFSLIELLIVVTMLLLVAAIAVPRLLDASEDARQAALATDLQMLRRQIRMYKAQHRDRGPHLDENGGLDKDNLPVRMTGRTTVGGKLDQNGSCGPYMKAWPTNPFCADEVAGDIEFGTTTLPPRTGNTGWYYNTNTCIISPNSRKGGEKLEPLETEIIIE